MSKNKRGHEKHDSSISEDDIIMSPAPVMPRRNLRHTTQAASTPKPDKSEDYDFSKDSSKPIRYDGVKALDLSNMEILAQVVGHYKRNTTANREEAELYAQEMGRRISILEKKIKCDNKVLADQISQLEQYNRQLKNKLEEQQRQQPTQVDQEAQGNLESTSTTEDQVQAQLASLQAQYAKLEEVLTEEKNQKALFQNKYLEAEKMAQENDERAVKYMKSEEQLRYNLQVLEAKQQRFTRATSPTQQQSESQQQLDSQPKDKKSLTQLTSHIFYKLGWLSQVREESNMEDIQKAAKALTSHFDDSLDVFEETAKHLRETKEELTQAHNQKFQAAMQLQQLRSQLQGRDEIASALQPLLEKNNQEIEKLLQTGQAQTSSPAEHSPMSYAEVSRLPPTSPSKPKLLLSSTSESITEQDIQQQLNKLDTTSLPPVTCSRTRNGQLLVQCNTAKDLQDVQTTLESNEGITKVVQIKKLEPRRRRVIVFGAPEVEQPPPPTENDQTESLDVVHKDYIKSTIVPSLKNVLRKTSIDVKLYRVLKGKKDSGTSHLVLDLPERDANILVYQQKVTLRFNRCTIRPYVVVLRCFKCQRLGHSFSQCPNKELCAKCCYEHPTKECTESTLKRCINCKEDNANLGRGFDPRKRLGHSPMDSFCPSYKKFFQSAVLKENQKVSPSQHASGKSRSR